MYETGLKGFLDGGGFLLILVAIVGAVLLMNYGVGKLSQFKGRGFWLGFILAMVLSPLFGLLIVALVPADRQAQESRRLDPRDFPR